MQNKAERPWVLIRGAGDLATGTILRLHRCGFKVLALECADPSAIRRKAAFCEAVWQGSTTVEGVTCRRIEHAEDAAAVSAAGEVPLLVDETCAAAELLHPAAVVDAILAKRNLGTHRAMAPLTVGLGPGFTVGQDVDAVVETMRGHQLGRVIRQGAAIPNTGVPGNIGGYTKERVIHAPASGPMEFVPDDTGALIDIGAVVRKGQCIGRVGGVEVPATLDGVLRGEWGFQGHVTSDGYSSYAYKNHFAEFLVTGQDYYCLDAGAYRNAIQSLIDSGDTAIISYLREAAKHDLYVLSRTWSINGLTSGSTILTIVPGWQKALLIATAVLGVGFVACTAASAVMVYKKKHIAEVK